MRLIHTFQSLLQLLPGLAWFAARRVPVAPPQQLDLGLDRVTESGLPLRDAMAVRSAELWLALGEPRVALRELDTLAELSRQNAWSMRTQLRATHTADTSIAA